MIRPTFLFILLGFYYFNVFQLYSFDTSGLFFFFFFFNLHRLSLSLSVSVLVSGAPLSLPYPLIQPLTPYFSHTRSPLSLCFTFLSLSPSVSGAALPSFDCYSIPLSSTLFKHQGKVSFYSILSHRFFSPFYGIGSFCIFPFLWYRGSFFLGLLHCSRSIEFLFCFYRN
jgi:hypothetical protein